MQSIEEIWEDIDKKLKMLNESIVYKDDSLLLKKAGYFMGHRSYEKIGIIKFSILFFDSKINNDVIDKAIEDKIEILYGEYDDVMQQQNVICICDEFEWIHRDNYIPEYRVVVKRNVYDFIFMDSIDRKDVEFEIIFERIADGINT